ncbi:MAG: DNA polymerase I [Breznakibacter sp.]
MSDSKNEVYFLDAYALIYRAYYAFIRNPRINSKGLNTSAIFGFTNSLLEVLTKGKPEYLAVAFDPAGLNFRHNLYPQYKANREATPEDIKLAVPYIKKILNAMHIPILEKEGFEADDVIGTMAKKAEQAGYKVFMVTPDKDYAQLVSENIKIYKPKSNGNDIEIWGVQEVCDHFEVQEPIQVIDILGLWGDAADNIPGCPNIGEKKAKALIKEYGSIDGVYQNIEQQKGKQKENLATYEAQVKLSRQLATIDINVPIDFNQEDIKVDRPDSKELTRIFEELEFRTLITRIEDHFGMRQQAAPMGDLFAQAGINIPQTIDYSSFKTANNTDHNYYLIDNEMALTSLIMDLSVQKSFCFDTETTSLETTNAELVGISFSWKAHEAYYIPIPKEREAALEITEALRPVFEDRQIKKVGQNIKYDLLVLKNYNIDLKGELFDTMIAHFLLYPGLKNGMDFMAETYLHYRPISIEELIGKKGAQQGKMRDVTHEKIKEYAAEDADITWQLYEIFEPKLQESHIKDLFYNIEMPLVKVLADMEHTGVKIDDKALNIYAEVLKKQIAELEIKIQEIAGIPFNIASPKQVGEVLFDRLKIDKEAKKTKTGQYSTNEETLQKLKDAHPIVEAILEHRGLVKLLNTYVEALPKLINTTTERIHTSYNQTIVVTGRLSSTNPNLQNIPIRDESGKEIRKAFTASDEQHIFLSADYSQVELRLMAHFSEDKHLIEAFRQGEDIHTATAAKVFKVPAAEVTPDMRRKAKTANFGIIYGISAFGLAERLNIPRKEAKEIIDGYFENFPGVKNYMDACISKAREEGYVETLFGRRRQLDDINSRNSIVRGVAERNAINAPIQGTAADIIKIAMIDINQEMNSLNLKSKMILQVHDELNFDVCQEELETMKELVKRCMENACALKVPLTADMGIGKNWLEAH